MIKVTYRLSLILNSRDISVASYLALSSYALCAL